MKSGILLLFAMSCAGCAYSHANDDRTCRGLIVFDPTRTGASELYTSAPNGHHLRQLTTATAAGEFSRVADVSPDARRIAFQSRRNGDRTAQIYVMNCDGTSLFRVTDGNQSGNSPAWSPDGWSIAYVGGESEASAIYIVSQDGSGLRRVAGIPRNAFYPAWSPDARKLAFVAKAGAAWEIHVIDIQTGEVRQLTDSPHGSAGCGGPAWSPDGSSIAFDATWAGSFDVYVMRSNGTSVVRLTSNAAVDARPAWSPDGTRITFHSTRDRPSGGPLEAREGFEVYTMKSDGTEVRRITRNNHFDGHPDW